MWRYSRLITSLAIGLIGMAFYFITVPHVNSDEVLDYTVDTGDGEELEDLYLGGYIYDYSSFVHKDGETKLYEELPYLEQLDGQPSLKVDELLDKYPTLINDLVYDTEVTTYHILESEENITTASFRDYHKDYRVNLDTLYLESLNKETEEIEKDEITRDDYLDGDSVEILAAYEEADAPIVKLLFTITNWQTANTKETNSLILAEYNTETKDYSEETLKKGSDTFSQHEYYGYTNENSDLYLIEEEDFDRDSMYDEEMLAEEDNTLLVDFAENSLEELEDNVLYTLSDENELYGIESEAEETILRKYNAENLEANEEVTLDLDQHISLEENEQMEATTEKQTLAKIINNKLYLIQSKADSETLQPAFYQVFAVETGDEIEKGKINVDKDFDHQVNGLIIDEIGENTIKNNE